MEVTDYGQARSSRRGRKQGAASPGHKQRLASSLSKGAGGGQPCTRVKEQITIFEKKKHEDKMKMKTTTPENLVKIVTKQTRRPSLAGSPTLKRLNAKNRAKYSPLKNLRSQAVKDSQVKKENFSLLLNSWENLSTTNLTPAMFEEPRLKKNVDSQYQGCLKIS